MLVACHACFLAGEWNTSFPFHIMNPITFSVICTFHTAIVPFQARVYRRLLSWIQSSTEITFKSIKNANTKCDLIGRLSISLVKMVGWTGRSFIFCWRWNLNFKWSLGVCNFITTDFQFKFHLTSVFFRVYGPSVSWTMRVPHTIMQLIAIHSGLNTLDGSLLLFLYHASPS